MDLLTHFNPLLYFYTPWKRQKTKGFLAFSEGIEVERWAKMGQEAVVGKCYTN